jgi:TonB family protein
MHSNRAFQVALFISLITHGIILFQNPNLNLFPSQKTEQKLETSYVKSPQEQKVEAKTKPATRDPILKIPPKITVNKMPPPPFVNKESIFRESKNMVRQNPEFTKPIFIRPDVIAIKKKITLPPIDLDKIDNPSYISYYQIVREKIRRSAYQNYTRQEVGEAYLSFIISNSGYLKEVRLSEEKSSASQYLKDVALRSVKEASPFPNFPPELDYPHLSFNVIISFEIE